MFTGFGSGMPTFWGEPPLSLQVDTIFVGAPFIDIGYGAPSINVERDLLITTDPGQAQAATLSAF